MFPKYRQKNGLELNLGSVKNSDLLELFKNMLALNPRNRISARDALDNGFFWDIPEEALI